MYALRKGAVGGQARLYSAVSRRSTNGARPGMLGSRPLKRFGGGSGVIETGRLNFRVKPVSVAEGPLIVKMKRWG